MSKSESKIIEKTVAEFKPLKIFIEGGNSYLGEVLASELQTVAPPKVVNPDTPKHTFCSSN